DVRLNLTVFAVTRQRCCTSSLYTTSNDPVTDAFSRTLRSPLLPPSERFRAMAQPAPVLRMERFLQQLTPHNSGGDYRRFALHRSLVVAAKGHWQFLCFACSPALRLQNHDQDRADFDPEIPRARET